MEARFESSAARNAALEAAKDAGITCDRGGGFFSDIFLGTDSSRDAEFDPGDGQKAQVLEIISHAGGTIR